MIKKIKQQAPTNNLPEYNQDTTMWQDHKLSGIIMMAVLFAGLRMTTGAFSILYILSKGLTLRDVALIKTLQAVFILIVDIPTAYLADKISRKFFIILGFLSASLWLLITGIATHFATFLIAEAFNALSLALLSGALVAYMIDYTHQNTPFSTKEILSRYTQWQFFTMAGFALLGAFLFNFNTLNVWYIAGGATLVLSIFALSYLPQDNKIKNTKVKCSKKDPITAEGKQQKALDQKAKRKNITLFFKESLQNRLIIMAVCLIILSLFYQVVIQFWQPFVFPFFKNFPHAQTWNGFYFVLLLIVQSLAGRILYKSSRGILLTLFIVLALIFFVFYGASLIFPNLIIPVLFILILFFTLRLFMTFLQSVIHDHIPSSHRATYDSSLSFVVRLFLLSVLPLAGLFFQSYGFSILFFIALLLILLSLGGVLLSKNNNRLLK